MIKLRKPSEVILKNGKTLEEVLELHNKWLKNEEGGERADLSYAILSDVNLSYTNLSCAILKGTNLSCAILKGTNLSCAILSEVNLSYAILRDANLKGTILKGTNLKGTNLENCKFYLTILYKCKGDFVSVGNIGSRNDTTHYFYKQNRVICGCFDGTMEEFKNKVKEYKQYIIAIDTLKKLAELELEK